MTGSAWPWNESAYVVAYADQDLDRTVATLFRPERFRRWDVEGSGAVRGPSGKAFGWVHVRIYRLLRDGEAVKSPASSIGQTGRPGVGGGPPADRGRAVLDLAPRRDDPPSMLQRQAIPNEDDTPDLVASHLRRDAAQHAKPVARRRRDRTSPG